MPGGGGPYQGGRVGLMARFADNGQTGPWRLGWIADNWVGMVCKDHSCRLPACAATADRRRGAGLMDIDEHQGRLGATRTGGSGRRRGRFSFGRRYADGLADGAKVFPAHVATHPTAEADLLHAFGQDMQQEPVDESRGGQRFRLFHVAVGPVPVPEGDLLEEQVDQGLAVVADQRIESVRQGENDMEVRDRQQLTHPLPKPSLPRRALAGRAVPVPAGVVEHGPVT